MRFTNERKSMMSSILYAKSSLPKLFSHMAKYREKDAHRLILTFRENIRKASLDYVKLDNIEISLDDLISSIKNEEISKRRVLQSLLEYSLLDMVFRDEFLNFIRSDESLFSKFIESGKIKLEESVEELLPIQTYYDSEKYGGADNIYPKLSREEYLTIYYGKSAKSEEEMERIWREVFPRRSICLEDKKTVNDQLVLLSVTIAETIAVFLSKYDLEDTIDTDDIIEYLTNETYIIDELLYDEMLASSVHIAKPFICDNLQKAMSVIENGIELASSSDKGFSEEFLDDDVHDLYKAAAEYTNEEFDYDDVNGMSEYIKQEILSCL